jgi:outer membrane lipoprotein-sorting protein
MTTACELPVTMKRVARVCAPFALVLMLVGVTACGHADKAFQLLDRVQDSTSLVGVRIYSCRIGSRLESSRERVILAPGGRFRIELLEVNGRSPEQMDEATRAKFEQVAARYRGSLGRRVRLERDFRVRDVQLAISNYEIDGELKRRQFLGREVYSFTLRSKHGGDDSRFYDLTIDLQTGFIVRSVERDASGTNIAEMVYEHVDFHPDLSSYDLDSFDHVGRVGSEPAAVQPDFSVLRPRWLPPGFVLAAEITTEMKTVHRVVMELVYTDGIQEIAIFENRSLNHAPFRGPAGTAEPYEVRLLSFGNVALADFVIDDIDVHIESKIEPGSLTTVIESLAN